MIKLSYILEGSYVVYQRESREDEDMHSFKVDVILMVDAGSLEYI